MPDKKYAPAEIRFANLGDKEKHKASFLLCNLNEQYIGHITNERVILEPHQYHSAASPLIDILTKFATSMSDSYSFDFRARDTKNKLKESQKRMKKLQEKGAYLEIPYSRIKDFERYKPPFKIAISPFVWSVKINLTKGDEPFNFFVYRVTESSKNWGGLIPCTDDFIEIATKRLKKYRKKYEL